MSNIISFNELITRLKNDEYNILAFIVTPWHLLGVRALLERLKVEGKYKNHLICILPHADTGYVFNLQQLADDCFFLEEKLPPDLNALFHRKFSLFLKSQIGNTRNPLYLISSWNYRINTTIYLSEKINRKIIVCKVDEGVATYMNTSNPLYLSVHNGNWKQLLIFIASRFFYLFLNNNLNCNLFYSKRGRLEPNNSIIPYYKKVLFGNNQEIHRNSRLIVIGTMAFAKEEVYNDELAHKLDYIISGLKKKDYECEIKPHPREVNIETEYSKYNVRIVDKKYSMEEYLITAKPMCLISFSSTSLITSKLFYNIKPISLINLLDLNCFSKKYFNELNTFRSVFKDIVYFPKTMDELIQQIGED